MYSPPIPRMVRAILAKLSEPRNDLGLIMMYSPFSSNAMRASRSSGKDILTSVRLRVLDDSTGGGAAVVAGLGAEVVTCTVGGLVIWPTASDFRDAETVLSSSCILAMEAFISSSRVRIKSIFSLSLPLTCNPL